MENSFISQKHLIKLYWIESLVDRDLVSSADRDFHLPDGQDEVDHKDDPGNDSDDPHGHPGVGVVRVVVVLVAEEAGVVGDGQRARRQDEDRAHDGGEDLIREAKTFQRPQLSLCG